MGHSIKLSRLASDDVSKLISNLKMDRPTVLRLAFAIGLKNLDFEEAKKLSDNKGVEIPLSVINGKDEIIFKALVRFKAGRYLEEDQLKEYYKYFIEAGIQMLLLNLENLRDYNEYLINMAINS